MITKQELVTILKDNGFTETEVTRILNKKISTLLKQGRKENIKQILEVLNKYEISKEAIEKCLSVLAIGKANEIEKIFEILNKNSIENSIVEKYFGYVFFSDKDTINGIFAEGSQNLKRFLQLKGYYDRIISEEEIDGICKEKKITKDKFLTSLMQEYADLYKETLKRKNGIYIGKPIPIEKHI